MAAPEKREEITGLSKQIFEARRTNFASIPADNKREWRPTMVQRTQPATAHCSEELSLQNYCLSAQ
jgi:hypothetical protein